MKRNSLINFAVKWLVDIMLVVGVICVIAVPFAAKTVINRFYGYSNSDLIIFAAMLIITGCAAVYILWCLRSMIKTLFGGNPFSEDNARAFGHIAIACAVIAAVYIVKCILLFSWSTLVIIAMFLIGALGCLTLKGLFEEARSYKDEHDWTV
ncbi:MAG: DUF2975 domain-containing protein [Oscillospiraceae bacterium]|nr:DUF2975 domain-containing protein [Oscillospiraceae bacterium]